MVKGEEILSEITYIYDEAGNVVSKDESTKTPTAGTISSISMTYDKANRLLTYNGENVTYDAEGNMTYGPDAEGNMTEYKYNCRNQLIQAGNIAYEYDTEGNRVAQTNTETDVRTEYVVNTVSELSQVLVATETVRNSETTENAKDSEIITHTNASEDATKVETTKVTTYVYGNGLLTQQSGEEYFVFHYNNIGSTILLTNATGEAEETYSYGPYGELLSGDSAKTRYLYNGMYGVATDDNGLYYIRARYYNVSIKRFINQDIINGSITNSQSLNKFSYVQGNPIKLTDPFGLFPCISLSGIGHAALSLLGIIPALDFCDAINAAWYFAEGDYANATISMVAATPFIGSVAGTGIKWGMKATTKAQKIAETVKLGSRIAGGAGGFIISGAQALEAVKNIHANRGADEDGSTWSNVGDYLILGLSIAGMGLSGVSIAKSGKALNGLWKGQDVVEAAAVSNATRRVASETSYGKSSSFSSKPDTTRINLANGRTRFTPLRQSGKPVSAGMNHVIEQHFDRPLANSRSIFSTSVEHLKEILQRKDVISSPLTDMGGGQYKRVVDTGEIIGNTALKYGGDETSWIEIITDVKGNIITAYPVPGK